MKPSLAHLDNYRIQEPHPSAPGATHGMFQIPHPDNRMRHRYKAYFNIIASSGSETEEGAPPASGWDHVSAHVRFIADNKIQMRCPVWAEMCAIKEAFFEPEEVVVQYHIGKTDHINIHPSVLHLWRPVDLQIPMPPKIFV